VDIIYKLVRRSVTIKTMIRSLKEVYLAGFFLFLFFVAPVVADAATYYVSLAGNDNNSGTSVNNTFRTIQKCLNTAQAGDICSVSVGDYSEYITTVRSGTEANRIYLVGNGNGNVKPAIRQLNINHAYFTVEGFLFNNIDFPDKISDASSPLVSVGAGGNYCQVFRSDFQNAIFGISINSGLADNPRGCVFRENRFRGSAVVSVMIGLQGSGHLVEGNDFGPLIMHEDIFRPFGFNHVIRNNTFHQITSGGTGGHMDIFQAWGGSIGNGNITFERNFVSGWPGQAFMIDCPDSSRDRLITIRNNVFANVNSAGQSYCPETIITNNTFFQSGLENNRAIMIRSESGRGLGDHSRIANNIFYQTGVDSYGGGYNVDVGAQSTFEARYNVAYPYTRSGLDKNQEGRNGEVISFRDSKNLLGADGKPFTADDGLIPSAGSFACGLGPSNSIAVGAYSCDGAGGLPVTTGVEGNGGGTGVSGGAGTNGEGSTNNVSPLTVRFVSPARNEIVFGDFNIEVAIEGVNNDTKISRVVLTDLIGNNSTNLSENLIPPETGASRATYTVSNPQSGIHTYQITVYDSSGGQNSSQLRVEVKSCVNSISNSPFFADPCPVLIVDSPAKGKARIWLRPVPSLRQYIYKKIYIFNPDTSSWIPLILQSCGGNTLWCNQNAYLEAEFESEGPFSGSGTHYIASWDWTWDNEEKCWVGPGSNACGDGSWRIQRINVD
jgi:hypothetical protein